MDLTKELGLSKKQPEQPKENLFQKANKQEEEVLKALLKIAPFNTYSYEAIYKSDPQKATVLTTPDGRELPRPDISFYSPDGLILIDVKNVTHKNLLSRNTFKDKSKRELSNIKYTVIEPAVLDPYKEFAKITGAIKVYIVFVVEGDFYISDANNCDYWNGKNNKGEQIRPEGLGGVYQFYFEDCQPNKKKIKGLIKIN